MLLPLPARFEDRALHTNSTDVDEADGHQLAEGVLATGWPILATAGWTVALLAVAMWRLDRTNF